MTLAISLAPETVFQLGSLAVTNSMLASFCLTVVLSLAAVLLGQSIRAIPNRVQGSLELIYGYFLDLTERIIGRADIARFIFPYVITLFLFVILSYWFGLLPGLSAFGLSHTENGTSSLIPLFRSPTSDINTVAGLACASMLYVQAMNIRVNGVRAYLGTFFNVRSGLDFFTGLLELMTNVNRLISFTFRLFGNVFAGEVLVAVILYLTITLVPYLPLLPLPFLFLEVFVGAIQAFIFAFLTIVLTSLAVSPERQAEPTPLNSSFPSHPLTQPA